MSDICLNSNVAALDLDSKMEGVKIYHLSDVESDEFMSDTYGHVCYGKLAQTKDPVTVILQEKETEWKPNDKTRHVFSLQHPTLIPVCGIVFPDKLQTEIGVVMKHTLAYSLEEYLEFYSPKTCLSGTQATQIIYGIAAGLKYLHDHKIIHGFIHPSTIFLDGNYHPYISLVAKPGDFFNPVIVDDYLLLNYSTDKSIFSSPEMINDAFDRVSTKTDIYSLSILIEVLLLPQEPFRVLSDISDGPYQDTLNAIAKGVRPNRHLPDPISDLVQKMWDQNPNARPSAEEICQIFEKKPRFCSTFVAPEQVRKYISEVSSGKECHPLEFDERGDIYKHARSLESQPMMTSPVPLGILSESIDIYWRIHLQLPAASVRLGIITLQGCNCNVLQNKVLDKAQEYFEEAVHWGAPEGVLWLGRVYAKKGELEKAKEQLMKCAKDVPDALYDLSQKEEQPSEAELRALRVKQKEGEALDVTLLKKGAKRGSLQCLWKLAKEHFESMKGDEDLWRTFHLEKEPKSAEQWFRMGAGQGSVECMFETGEDIERAAKEGRYAPACLWMSRRRRKEAKQYLLKTPPDQIDKELSRRLYAEAVNYLHLAGEDGEAYYRLGKAFLYGDYMGQKVNQMRAHTYFDIGSRLGSVKAKCAVGRMYETGMVKVKNGKERALAIYREAAKTRYAWGQYFYGRALLVDSELRAKETETDWKSQLEAAAKAGLNEGQALLRCLFPQRACKFAYKGYSEKVHRLFRPVKSSEQPEQQKQSTTSQAEPGLKILPKSGQTKAVSKQDLDKISLLLLGDAAAGKSSFGNLFLGEELLEESQSSYPVTKKAITKSVTAVDGTTKTVIDTEGFNSGETVNDEQIRSITTALRRFKDGINGVALVLNGQCPRFSQTVKDILWFVNDCFGTPEVFRHICIVFTRVYAAVPNYPNRDQLREEYGEAVRQFLQVFSNEIIPKVNCYFVDSKDPKGAETEKNLAQLEEWLLSREAMATAAIREAAFQYTVQYEERKRISVGFYVSGDTKYEKFEDQRRTVLIPNNGDSRRYTAWEGIHSYAEAIERTRIEKKEKVTKGKVFKGNVCYMQLADQERVVTIDLRTQNVTESPWHDTRTSLVEVGRRTERTLRRTMEREEKVVHHQKVGHIWFLTSDETTYEIYRITYNEEATEITDFDGKTFVTEWRIVPGSHQKTLERQGNEAGFTPAYITDPHVVKRFSSRTSREPPRP